MKMKAIEKIKTQEEARNIAIKWENWACDTKMYYSELAEWGEYFSRLAKKFDLLEEFEENGII